MLASGSRDRNVLVRDVRTNDPSATQKYYGHK